MQKVVPIIDIPYNKIHPRVLTCGDPKRAEKIASRLDNIEVVSKSREYWTYNGTYKGVPVTVSSHGVGGGGASVSFEGLILGGAKVIIRVGTCGVLQTDLGQGTLIIASAACREDGISSQIIPMSYPAFATPEVVLTMSEVAEEISDNVKTGIITTSGVFYPGQVPSNNQVFADAGVLAMENEAAVLFVIAALNNVKSGCIVAADGPCFEFVGAEDFDHYPEKMDKAIEDEITIALESIIKIEV